MITRIDLDAYLNELLKCSLYSDYAPNGLQVEGKGSIKRICTAVTASDDVIAQALKQQADAVLVHHGYFWRGENPVITGMKRQRIAKLLSKDVNLFAYHLPLDCHPELGNNACIGKLLDIDSIKSHKVGSTDNLLWSGTLSQAMNGQQLALLLQQKFNQKPLHIAGHDKQISRLAWCSGGAQDYIVEANALGVDAYLSGEVSERTFYQAKELAIDYFACGHHATERYGIQALGKHLANAFNLQHEFLDSNNPV